MTKARAPRAVCACASPLPIHLRGREQRDYCDACQMDLPGRAAGAVVPAVHLTAHQYVEKMRGHLPEYRREFGGRY